MAFLIDIGVGILTKLAEYTVEPAIRQVGYIICYNKNLQKLQDQAGELVEAGESIRHAVAEEERKGKKIETGVQKWLTEVDQLTNKANGLKDEHHAQTKCLCGFCPNIKLRHRLSRKSTKMVQDVAELFEKKKNFDRIGYVVPPEPVCLAATQGYEAYDSRTSIAKDVINELGNSNTYMIGVYGVGGVGKTTLVKQVYKQLATGGENLFDEVVMVLDLKKNPSIDRIQKEIAEKLGLEFPETKTEAGRASEICNRIKAKKTLVILDDVWEKIDLEDVGLPRMETLKMLLTSRSKQVLSSDMGTQKEFPLDVLDKDESWSLFQKTAGGIVENPDVGTIATKVADKCGGLPLLIVTVARSLKNSPLHAWKDTLRRLKRMDGKGVTEKTYSAIEWSYNKLDNEELKSLFLLCGNVVSDANYWISDLWKYSMGLGLLKDMDTIGEAWDALCSMIEQLKDSCLLLAIESDDNKRVRMHDLVIEVAKRISSRDQHVLSLSSGSELEEWPDKDFCSKCTMINLDECQVLELPEVLVCPELTMFHLQSTTDDSSRQIPSNFFGETRKLRVLDLTCLNIPFLPSSLVFLESLRTLCLDQCTLADVALIGQLQSLEILSFLESKFKELPTEIGQLRRLRLLDLNDCSELQVISPNVLSSLKRLEHLRMRNSFNRWEAGGVIATTISNASLEELKQLTQLADLQIHIPDANILPPDLFTESKLEKFQICIGSVWKWDDVDETMNALKLHTTAGNQFDQGLKMLLNKTEDLYLEGTQGVHSSIVSQVGVEGLQKLKHLHFQNNVELTNFTHIINKKVTFPNLTWLEVGGLDDLRFLLSCSTARSLAQLKRLQISKCQIMEAIVSTEESDESAEKLFPQLQDLELKDLPMLSQFCSGNNSGLSFERLRLEECAKRDTICEDTEEMDSPGNIDNVVPHFLFDNKIKLLNLKKLFINGLPELTTLWNNQESSKNLETIEILSCDNLKSIFPASIARSLQQLRRLKVENCGVLEEIVSKEDGVETIPMFVFPTLTYMWFRNLPRLQSFYPGLHSSKWPSLLTLWVYGCDKLTTFEVSKPEWNNAYVCTPIKQSLFLLDKDSFPSIAVLCFEIMENWDSQTLHYFKKLSSLRIYEKNEHTNSRVNSFEKLFGLENGNEEIHLVVGDRSLPLLRELFLHRMKSLMNIGDDSFRPAGSYIPNLETLELEDCDSLKNLRSSAISFKALRTLKVSCCKGMKYLLDLSMAGSLMQLTKLEVGKCEEMVDIITSDGNGDPRDNEIEFSVLKHLELFDLPSLRSFCSGAGILKFPSLENLSMSNCTRLETFILDSMDESDTMGKNIKETDSTENHEAGVVRHFLFDNKVELPSLKSLSLKGLKLRVLDLTRLNIPLPPSSLVFLESLRMLCLDHCTLGDVALIGQLHSLEILSFQKSKFKELPKEIGQLRRLRLLDLNDCSDLRVISPNVLSSLKRLEHLRMRNSFNRWEAGGVIATTRSNASLEELKQLTQLADLQIHIPDANILPPDLFTESKLEKFQICIGSVWKWDDVDETMNALKLHTTAGNQFDQGLKMLLNKTEDLYLEGTQGVHSSIVSQVGVEGLQKLKHLHFQNNVELTNFTHIINKKVAFPNLTWLEVGGLDDLRFLLSCSTARSLAQLKRLQISKCQIMEAIVSTEESDESAEKLFPQLQDLELTDLPMLTQFCSGNNSGLSFERLRLEECAKRDTICEDTEEMDSPGNVDIVVPHFLFDNKIKLLNLKKLFINGLPELTTLWNNQDSSKNLETIEILSCDNLKSIFPASIARSLQQLRRLKVENCGVLEEIVSKEDGVETIPMFVFPTLTYMWFRNLPRLQSFYPGLHSSKWPSLLCLAVYGFDKLTTFEVSKPEWNNAYVCTPIKQSLFLLDKDSFPSIEVLGFEIMENWDSQTLHYFKKLIVLRIYEKNEHTKSRVNSFEKLVGLENGNEEIHPVVGDRSLPLLRRLFLHRMKSLMNIGDDSFRPAGSYIPNLETLELEDCDSLKNLRSSAISFKALRTLKVSCCKGMKYLLDLSMAGSLMQLTKLEVGKCEEMVDIITSDGNGDPRDNEIEFSVLKHLELFDLPSLRSFCSGAGILKFPSLENLSMSNCARLETLILDSMDESDTMGKNIKETDSTENHEAGVVRHFLFDNKVELPSLKSLSLKGLTKLTSIWHSQLSLNSFSRLKDLGVHGCGNLLNIFVPSTMGRLNALEALLIAECKSLQVVFELGVTDVRGIQGAAQQRYFDCGHLSSVEIKTCEGLQNIFPASVARNLQQLKSLIVWSSGVEEIVTKQEESMETTPKFVFPKVTQVHFYDLPQLTNFYRGMHLSSWPSLHEMRVVRCPKVNIFVEEISNFQGQINVEHPCALIPPSLFIMDKDSFPNVEILSVNAMEFSNNGQLPGAAELFCKLKFLDVCCPKSKSVVFLEEHTSTSSAVGSGSHRYQQQLHHLKKLRLIRMEKLMHLDQYDDEDNSQSATRIPNYPNLQILFVKGCHVLRNLRSSAISFENLTSLRVRFCKGLEYLITYSMANSLRQLTKLKVEQCPTLVEIVGSNEDDNSTKEITFRRLKHLKLANLPRLQGFCSGNCIAKFPSLETSSMSNRLRLKIFSAHDQMIQPTDEQVDTDEDYDDEDGN